MAFQMAAAAPGLTEPSKASELLGDSRIYVRSASNLLEHGRYSSSLEPPLAPDHFKPPGYSLFLAAVFAFSRSVRLILALQMLLWAANACIAYGLGRSHFGSRRVGLWAGLLTALSPNAAFHAGFILSDPLFTLFLLAGLHFLFLHLREGRPAHLAACSLMLGLSAWVRAVALFLSAAVPAYLLFRAPRRKPPWVSIGLFLALFGLVLAPWYLRNHRVFGRAFLATTGEYTLFVLWADPLLRLNTEMTHAEAQSILAKETDEEARKRGWDLSNPPKAWKARADIAKRHILRSPARYLPLHLAGSLRTLLQPLNFSEVISYYAKDGREAWGGLSYVPPLPRSAAGIPAWLRKIREERFARTPAAGRWILFLGVVHVTIMWFGAGLGVLSFKKTDRSAGVLLLMIAYFALLTGPSGEVRFRLCLEPLAALLAGLGYSSRA